MFRSSTRSNGLAPVDDTSAVLPYPTLTMSDRASKTRQRLRGQICCFCYAVLQPLPAWTRGERFCETCAPRPHRVLMTFVPRVDIYSVGFLEADANTSIAWPFTVKGKEALRALVERCHGDLEHLNHALSCWGQGSAWLQLTKEQYQALVKRGRRKPPQSSR